MCDHVTFKRGLCLVSALTLIYLGVIIFGDHLKGLVLLGTYFETHSSRQTETHIFIFSLHGNFCIPQGSNVTLRLQQSRVQILSLLYLNDIHVGEFFNLTSLSSLSFLLCKMGDILASSQN